jgi:hypothetical protein
VTWTKLGDEFPVEAKDLTDAEVRTHVEALCWSNWRLLDLHIPKGEVRRFAESRDAAAAVDGLVVKGWWEDRGDAWYIGVRFAEWQHDRSQVEHRRAYLAEAQRRSRRHKAGDHSLCLPGRCKHAPPSTAVSTVDSTVESTDPPQVGSGRDYVPPDPQDQNQDQDQEHSVANSQKPRVHHGPVNGSSPTPANQATDVGEQPQTVTRARTAALERAAP